MMSKPYICPCFLRYIHLIFPGTGTFGRVFLAEEEDKNQNGSEVVYAIKVMRIKDIIKLNQVEHVNSERKILQLTDHPFIVKW